MGRIGTVGRVRVDLFENDHEALGALEAIERGKRKRGYQDAASLMSDRRYSRTLATYQKAGR
jgi:predicted DNA-binding WGR domain protein